MEKLEQSKTLLALIFLGGVFIGSLVTFGVGYIESESERSVIQSADIMPEVLSVNQLLVNGVVANEISGNGQFSLILSSGKTVPVMVTDSTEVVKRTNRDLEEFATELEQNTDVESFENPPTPFLDEPVATTEIKKGLNIQVESLTSVVGASSIEASRVIVY